MKFSFTSLGCASAQPTVNRFPSAHVLNVHERLFLIDCGEGCQMQLRKYGYSFLKIQNIFISHIHGDHIFGIYGLLSTMSMLGRTAELFIYAPQTFSEILTNFLKHFGDSFKYEITHKILKPGGLVKIYDGKSMEILSFPLNHRIDCYGFLFREKQQEIARLKEGEDLVRDYSPYEPRSFAYCSDTAPYKEIYEYVKGVDLLYHEATFASDMDGLAQATMHSTARDAANVALHAGAKKLIIGHYSSRYKNINVLLNEAKEVFEETYLADEGKEFDLPLDASNTIKNEKNC
ncbi:MAG: ribonuclease Z [Bacteroidales bacterium]